MTARARLAGVLEGLAYEQLDVADGMPCLSVERAALPELMHRLRTGGGFETNTFVTAVDRFPAQPRFLVVYQFLSIRHNDRVRVHCAVPEDDARVPSIVGLWPGASFSERECYDMFGIRFDGHPDLRRLLMPEAYEHHPLRKDFPHQGIEPDRLYRAWDRKRRQPASSQP